VIFLSNWKKLGRIESHEEEEEEEEEEGKRTSKAVLYGIVLFWGRTICGRRRGSRKYGIERRATI